MYLSRAQNTHLIYRRNDKVKSEKIKPKGGFLNYYYYSSS